MTSDDFIWTTRRLRAAYWVGRVLGSEGELSRIAHESWIDLPIGSDITFEELSLAEEALMSIGLIETKSSNLRPDPLFYAICELSESEYFLLLFGLILERQSPLWLMVATGDGNQFSAELVPEEISGFLNELLPDAGAREAFLLARGRVVNVRELEEIGRIAEEKVVNACREELTALGAHEEASKVLRVSLISDELGYDITAPRLSGGTRRLEVKGTRTVSPSIAVYLSRNEYETGLKDKDWSLVIVRIGTNLEEILGWIQAAELEPLVPRDYHNLGQWQTARIRLDEANLNPYLPSPT